MTAKAEVLVVANRTAQSDELLETLCERHARGPVSFTLLVPAAWEVGDPHGGRETARRRLKGALERLRDAGLQVEGVLGDPDPALAVQKLWDPQRFDEVIVSTLPARISQWLKLDLPRRVERITGRPVRHVTASQGHQGEAAGGRAPTASGEGGPKSDQSPKVPSLRLQPSASYSFTMRLHMPQQGGAFAHVAEAIAESEALLGAIDLVRVERQEVVRDVTVACADAGHAEAVVRAVRALEGVRVDSVSDRTFLMHKGGKIEVNAKLPLKTRDDLSMAYTPGVARVSTAIHEDPGKAWALTIKSNTVAVVSDGSAVLGLGDVGPAAAMPVMEGKAMLFKEFAGVDAFPLCIDLEEVDEIVAFVRALAPTFGGINLEDIAAPRCFEIERRLRAELDIPVFHDDQHGTAIVVLAALLNALRVVGKRPEDVTVVVVGAGAAGVACTEILLAQGVGDVVVCNRRGALYAGAEDLDAERASLAERTNKRGLRGKPDEVLAGAHVLLGLSGPGAVSPAGVRAMAPDAIVFAMANPVPEVHPEEVRDDVAVMATGRSDYPNQINNVLAFPGVFKGALEVRARTINEEMELAAAHAIARVIPEQELHADYIIPSVFNRHVAESVADAVAGAAVASGVARRERGVHPHEPATPLEALR